MSAVADACRMRKSTGWAIIFSSRRLGPRPERCGRLFAVQLRDQPDGYAVQFVAKLRPRLLSLSGIIRSALWLQGCGDGVSLLTRAKSTLPALGRKWQDGWRDKSLARWTVVTLRTPDPAQCSTALPARGDGALSLRHHRNAEVHLN